MTNLGWDEKADVVVVGGGGAGLAAATAGAKTMVLEKTGEPGGKTAMSIGIMTASGTSVQRAAGDDVGPGRDGWARTGKPFIGTATGVGYAYLDDCRAWDWHFEGKTIAAAARHIGARPASLTQALANNAKGPLHVLGPARRVITNSGGGVATNQKTNVIAEDGRVIKGLFGAGVNARLISFMGGHGYALAWAMASGRIAGGNAARHAKTSG